MTLRIVGRNVRVRIVKTWLSRLVVIGMLPLCRRRCMGTVMGRR